ncbi:MAG: hypothetical protein ACRD2T_04470 [Thermoanaerobaculia bacterium]
MSRMFLVVRCLAVVLLVLVLAHCRPKSIEDQVAALPELPPEIAATLDPDTMATKVVSGVGPPETATGAILVPCCSSTETRQLKVRFRYTKCGPLADLFDLEFVVLTQGRAGSAKPEMHKLTEFRGRTLPFPHLCRSSDGPWNAILTEKRGCANPTPSRSLAISAFGDVISFTWGGPQSPPANVQVVACRKESFIRLLCPGSISTCDCSSSSCSAGQDCPCPLELPGPPS